MTTEKKTLLTNEEVLERLKEVLKANGWKGADFFMEAVFHDHIVKDTYYYVKGFIDAMGYGGILDIEESEFLMDSLKENRFGRITKQIKIKGKG